MRSYKIDWKIMFYTFPEAEINLPEALTKNGERSWRWVEFSLQIPYFFLSLRISNKGCKNVRYLALSHLSDVLDIARQQSESFEIVNLGLLSPGYVNGGEHYQLGAVKEIWSVKGYEEPNLFVMATGERFYCSMDGEAVDELEMELLLAI